MGVFTDLASNAKVIDFNPPALTAGQRPVAADIDALRDRIGGDAAYPSGFDALNEIQSIAHNALIDGGTFTLTFTLWDGTTFTTAAIAWNASAATIITAINTASPATVGDGHIVATGGNLATAPLVLTFSGTTVAGQNHAVSLGNSLTDGGVAVADPIITVTQNGQQARWAWAILKLFGVISDAAPPVQGTSSNLTSASNRATNPYYPDQDTIRALAKEIGIQDKSLAAEQSVLRVAGLSLDGR